TLVLPASNDDVLAALKRLRLWPLLDGYRGRAKADVSAVVDVAAKLCTLMLDDLSIEEIEINPVMVKEQGAVAVDALVGIVR
ncbi:MAG: acetate--CoA ligase family protein, partial [Rhizobiaceae bacterium]